MYPNALDRMCGCLRALIFETNLTAYLIFSSFCHSASTPDVLICLIASIACCRMYACVRALIFGEDFTTDPVSRGLGFALRYFSGGAIALNVPLVSQVRVTCLRQLDNIQNCTAENAAETKDLQGLGLPSQCFSGGTLACDRCRCARR